MLPSLVLVHWGFSGFLLTLVAFFLLASPFLLKVPSHGRKQEVLKKGSDGPVKPYVVFIALLGLLLFFGGIAGIWGQCDEETVRAMMLRLVHRGPDAQGSGSFAIRRSPRSS